MAWIESHQSLGSHIKLLKFKRLLKVKDYEAVGLLHYFWWWALDNIPPDGDLDGLTAGDIAEQCHWKGRPDRLLNALIDAGFVDGEPFKMHDWSDYSGLLNIKREQRREQTKIAQQRHREKLATENNNVSNKSALTQDDSKRPTVPTVPTVPNKVYKEKYIKRKYGEFKNVLLTDGEYLKLKEKFGDADERIKALSIGIKSKGYVYKSHYATILNWDRMKKEKENGKDRPRNLPSTYTDPKKWI